MAASEGALSEDFVRMWAQPPPSSLALLSVIYKSVQGKMVFRKEKYFLKPGMTKACFGGVSSHTVHSGTGPEPWRLLVVLRCHSTSVRRQSR